jgi:hypothetical protein
LDKSLSVGVKSSLDRLNRGALEFLGRLSLGGVRRAEVEPMEEDLRRFVENDSMSSLSESSSDSATGRPRSADPSFLLSSVAL